MMCTTAIAINCGAETVQAFIRPARAETPSKGSPLEPNMRDVTLRQPKGFSPDRDVLCTVLRRTKGREHITVDIPNSIIVGTEVVIPSVLSGISGNPYITIPPVLDRSNGSPLEDFSPDGGVLCAVPWRIKGR